MFAMGIMLLLIGYGLIWTGVERFRGDKVSLLGAFGLPGGTVTTVGPTGTATPEKSKGVPLPISVLQRLTGATPIAPITHFVLNPFHIFGGK